MYFMRVIERAFSELLRRPKDVVGELEEHDVVLRRRNQPALRLSQEDRAGARDEVIADMARLLRKLAVRSPAAVAEAVEEAFPWSSFLPAGDRDEFVRELTRTLAASADIDNFAPAAQMLLEWRSTAEIHADPKLARRLRGTLVADGKVVDAPAS